MRAILIALLLAPLAVPQQSVPDSTAQTPPVAAKKTAKFDVTTQLVVVNVAVKTKNGDPVDNLTTSDFTVSEDGKPQEIKIFEFQRLEDTPLSAPALVRRIEEAPASPVPASLPAVKSTIASAAIAPAKPGEIKYRDRRLLVLFVDPAGMAVARTDRNSMLAHGQRLDKARKGGIDIYFEGDSITRRWGATDYPDLLANWKQNFFGWNAADFGWGADSVQNILWRLENGELDGVNPKVIVLLAGTNNVGGMVPPEGDDAKVTDISRGLEAVLHTMQWKAPNATIILTAIFPRNDNMAVMPTVDKINANLAKLADGKRVRFLNLNAKLADQDGKLYDGMMNVRDKLHPQLPGYQVWAEALKPIFNELLGPPAKTDHAPPPTGDPSASK